MPLVLTLLPLVGLSFLADERIEWALVGCSAVLGVSSLCLGRREHGSRRALAVLSVGLALLVLGRMMEQLHLGIWGVVIVVLGGVTVAGAHLLNRRSVRPATSATTPPKKRAASRARHPLVLSFHDMMK
jgi:drug/metabolite transporter (DMT)-like permease